MSKEPKDKETKKEVEKELSIKNASVDPTVKVEALERDPYHKTGTVFEAGKKKAEELEERGWVKILKTLLLLAVLSFGFKAEAQIDNFKSVYDLTLDTVTNGGTVYLQSSLIRQAPATSTVVWVSVTKISGTVGGTLTLQGSLDGTNFKALNTPNTATALATFTATDATNTYHWNISGSPFLYYRVSWTGTGTMAASFTAKLFRSK